MIPRVDRYSDDALSLKFLSNVTHPDPLALEAVTELRASAGSRRFEQRVAVNGVNINIRNYQAMVTHFDSIWRGLFKQGIIRSRAAGKKHDGALAVGEDEHAFAVGDHDHGDHHDDDAALWVGKGKGGGKGKGSRWQRGRGGRGGRFIPHNSTLPQRPNGNPNRPRLCDICWKSVLDAPADQKMNLIQAILGRASARAFLATEDDEQADEEQDQEARHTFESNPADLLAADTSFTDSMIEDYADLVIDTGTDDLPDPLIGASSSSWSPDETIRFYDDECNLALFPDRKSTYVDCSKIAGIASSERGLFITDSAAKGSIVAYMEGQRRMPYEAALSRARSLGLPIEDSFISHENSDCFVDQSWQDACNIPDWYRMNHGHPTVANCKMVTLAHPNGKVRDRMLAWQTTRDVLAHEELRFPYCGTIPQEWNNDMRDPWMPADVKRRRKVSHSTSLDSSKEELYGPYKHRPYERSLDDMFAHNVYDQEDIDFACDHELVHKQGQKCSQHAIVQYRCAQQGSWQMPQMSDGRSLRQRLRSMILVMQLMRRKLAARACEYYRRFASGWNHSFQCPFQHRPNNRHRRRPSFRRKWTPSPPPSASPPDKDPTCGCTHARAAGRRCVCDVLGPDGLAQVCREQSQWGCNCPCPGCHPCDERVDRTNDVTQSEAITHIQRQWRIYRRNAVARVMCTGLAHHLMRQREQMRTAFKMLVRNDLQDLALFYRPHKSTMRAFARLKSLCAAKKADNVYAVPDADVTQHDAADQWVADSGCSVHCVSSVDQLTGVTRSGAARPLRVADKRYVHVSHTGFIDMPTVAVTPDGQRVTDQFRLARVLVVPSFKTNLFSCSAARRTDKLRTVLDGPGSDAVGYIELPSHNRILLSDKYEFTLRVPSDVVQAVSSPIDSSTLPHRRLAHFSDSRLVASGIPSKHDPTDCPACMLNAKRGSFPSKSKVQRRLPPRAVRFGQIINSDLLSMPDSIENYRYLMVFVDEASSESFLRFLTSKSSGAVLQALQSFVAENAHLMDGGRVATWNTDNGGEFDSSEIDAYCNAVSTHQTRTPAHTPELNGKAERLNGIIVRGVRILLAESNLSEGLWPYAATHVNEIHKRLQSRALDPPISPYEFNRKRKPNLDKYKVWGCKCYVHLEKEERAKFGLLKTDPSGMIALHLGYDHIRHGYYVYVPQIKRYTTVRTIKFVEDELLEVPELSRHERVLPARRKQERAERDRVQANINTRLAATQNVPNAANLVSCGRYSRAFAVSDEGPIPTPKSYGAAMSGEYAEHWLAAMQDDLKGKSENGPNGAWTLVDLAQAAKLGRTPLKGKWVFKIKYAADGYTINKFKARWVGCGYAQREHIDYNETFASTIRAVTVRIVLAAAADLDLMLGVFDVVKAFTQSEMHETLFVEQPTGFEVPGKICKLNMALEGTKQAAHLWQQNLNRFMTEFKFERSLADPCLYVLREGEVILICAVHVDDVLCAYNANDIYEKFWVAFSKRFKSTRGPVDTYLGMEVHRDRDAGRITLTQSVYVEKMFSKYLSENNTKSWTTPIDMSKIGTAKFYSIKTAESEKEINEMKGKDFNGLLGTLLYACCMTRPDVAFYTGYLCQFMQAPSVEAWDAALSIASYLNTTRDLGISFTKGVQGCCIEAVDTSKNRLIAFSDASFGRDVMPFAGGFVQWRGGPISWLARKAKFVPQSSCESEVFGAVMILKETEFASQVISFISPDLELPTAGINDNKAAVDVIKFPGATKRTVHFDRWLHFARELCLRNKAEMFLVGTDDMMADIFTKALDKTKFLKCRNYITHKTG